MTAKKGAAGACFIFLGLFLFGIFLLPLGDYSEAPPHPY